MSPVAVKIAHLHHEPPLVSLADVFPATLLRFLFVLPSLGPFDDNPTIMLQRNNAALN